MSGADVDGDRFLLELVPVGENVRTARLFGASIARHFNCDEELVEDLKLALSESMNRALRESSDRAAGPIRLTARASSEALTFSVEGPAGSSAGAGADRASGTVGVMEFGPSEEELILALFPDATFGEGIWSTEFSVSLG